LESSQPELAGPTVWAIAQVRKRRRRAAAGCCFQRWCLQTSGPQLAIRSAPLLARGPGPPRLCGCWSCFASGGRLGRLLPGRPERAPSGQRSLPLVLHGVVERRTNESSTLPVLARRCAAPRSSRSPPRHEGRALLCRRRAGRGLGRRGVDRDPVAAASASNLSVATVRRNLPSPMERIGGVGGRGRAGQERRVAVCHAPWRTGTRSSASIRSVGAARRHGHRDRRLGPMGGVDSIASRRDGWAAAEGHQARGGCRFDRRW